MKKVFLSMILFVALSSFANQQQQQEPNGGIGNLQGIKIAYLTKQLNLTSDEAQKFWPIYYNYSDEVTAARKDLKDNVIGLDEKLLALKKKYWVEFKKILGTDERVNKGFLAEREFGNYIKKEIENRQKLRALRQQNKTPIQR